MATCLQGSWLDRPLAAAFLGFNLLPAGLLHASRMAAWGTTDEPQALRHLSRSVLRSMRQEEAVVDGFDDPALAVFMAPDEGFRQLRQLCGLVPLIPSIRRMIAREEIQALRAELSDREFEFARGGGARWVPAGLDPGLTAHLGQVCEQAQGIGEELLFLALGHASPPVACRGRLRLPRGLTPALFRWPLALHDGKAALALARGVMHEMDPEWLSLFPTSP